MPRLPRNLRQVLALAAGAALLLFFFRHDLGADTFLVRRDAFRLYLPLWQFLSEEVHAHHLPTWYPNDALGVSAVGSSVAGLLHPLTWLLLVLPPDQAIKWEALACYPIALAGMYRLSRRLGAPPAGRWLAGLAYSLSGYLLSVSENPLYAHGCALLPWVALMGEGLARRPTAQASAGLALALALTLWVGDLQGVLIQVATVFAILASHARTPLALTPSVQHAWRRRIWALGGAFALFGLLGAPLWGPIWVTFQESGRAGGLGAEEAMTWAVHPARLLELPIGSVVPPEMLGSGWGVAERYLGGHFASLWSLSEFLGTATLACTLLALLVHRPSRRTMTLYGGLATVGLLLALGKAGGLYPLLYQYLPLGKAFRYPEKMMPLALLGLCALAGWGVRALHGRRRSVIVGLAAAGAMALSCAALSSTTSVSNALRALDPSHAEPDPEVAAGVARVLAARLAIGGGWLLALAILAAWRRPVALWGAPILQFLQVVLTCGAVVGIGPTTWLSLASPLVPTLEQAFGAEPRRICRSVPGYHFDHPPPLYAPDPALMADVLTLDPDQGARWGIGNSHPYLPGFARALSALCAPGQDCGTDCSRAEGVRWGVVSTSLWADLQRTRPELREMQRLADPEVVLFEDPRARGFAALPGVHYEPSEAAAQSALDEHRFDLASQVVAVGAGPDAPPASGTVSARRLAGNHLEVEFGLDAPGNVVISESCARGWQAELDGSPIPLEKANLTLCRVEAPAGHHHLDLRYLPPTWPWAFLLYGLGWLGVGLGLQRGPVRRTGRHPVG